MRILRTTLPVLILLALTGCVVNIIDGSGNVISEARTVSGFDRVALDSIGRLEIVEGAGEALEIEADDNLMQYIQAEVVDGELQIGFSGDAFSIGADGSRVVRPSRTITYRLTVDDLREITLSGAGSVQIDRLSTDALSIVVPGAGSVRVGELSAGSLRVEISGAGRVVTAGLADVQEVEISGLGQYDGADLWTRDSRVTLRSAGSVTVWASGTLDIVMDGAGTIEYYGRPAVTQDARGAGTIVDKGTK